MVRCQASRLPAAERAFAMACLRARPGSAVTAARLLETDFFSPAVRSAHTLLGAIYPAEHAPSNSGLRR